jgi:hypothetical protein
MSLALGSKVEVPTRPRTGAPGAGRTRRRLSTLVAVALGSLCALVLASPAVAAPAPTNLRVSSAGQSTITLWWNGVQATYGTYLGGRYIANTKLFSYTFAGLSCGTAYTLGVRTFLGGGDASTMATISAATGSCSGSPSPGPSPAPAAPVNTALPSVFGTARVGMTLTASAGTWSGTSPFSYAYQWSRCDAAGGSCVPMSGGVASTYVPSATDAGARIRVTVRATNGAGSTSATSNASAAVAAAPSVPSPPQTTTPPPSGGGGTTTCLVSNRSQWALGGQSCRYGTSLHMGSSQFRCSRPLSSYGTLPLKVTWDFAANRNPSWGDQGALDLVSGCTGDGNPDTIDLIAYVPGDGRTFGSSGGAAKFRAPPGPTNIQVTGVFQCGPVAPGSAAHQDVWQFQGGSATSNLAIVNGVSGNWDAGTATCVGAGGATFWSTTNDIDILGGQYVTCNHGFFGAGQSAAGNRVEGAGFRTGRTEAAAGGGDPRCVGYSASNPCLGTSRFAFAGVTCQMWNAGRNDWDDVSPS